MHRRQSDFEKFVANLGATGHWSKAVADVCVYRSKIRASNDGGGVTYEPLTRSALILEDWTAMAVGHMARAWYCGWGPPVGTELQRSRLTPDLVRRLRELSETVGAASKICSEAAALAVKLSHRAIVSKSTKIMCVEDRQEIRRIEMIS